MHRYLVTVQQGPVAAPTASWYLPAIAPRKRDAIVSAIRYVRQNHDVSENITLHATARLLENHG